MMKQQELSPNLILILWLVAMPAAVMGAAIAEGDEDEGEVVPLQQLASCGVLGDLLRGAGREDLDGGERGPAASR